MADRRLENHAGSTSFLDDEDDDDDDDDDSTSSSDHHETELEAQQRSLEGLLQSGSTRNNVNSSGGGDTAKNNSGDDNDIDEEDVEGDAAADAAAAAEKGAVPPRVRRKTRISSPFFAREAAMLQRRASSGVTPTPPKTRAPKKISSPFLDNEQPAPVRRSTSAGATPNKISSPFFEAEKAEIRRRSSVAAGARTANEFEASPRDGARRGSVFNRSTAEKLAGRRMSRKARAYMEAAKRAKEEEEARLAAERRAQASKSNASDRVKRLQKVFIKPKKDGWSQLLNKSKMLRPNKTNLDNFNKSFKLAHVERATTELGDIGSLLEDALELQAERSGTVVEPTILRPAYDCEPLDAGVEPDLSMPDFSAQFQAAAALEGLKEGGVLSVDEAQRLIRSGSVRPLPDGFWLKVTDKKGEQRWAKFRKPKDSPVLRYVGRKVDQPPAGKRDLTKVLVGYGVDSFEKARAFFASRDMANSPLYDTEGNPIPLSFSARFRRRKKKSSADGAEDDSCSDEDDEPATFLFSLKPLREADADVMRGDVDEAVTAAIDGVDAAGDANTAADTQEVQELAALASASASEGDQVLVEYHGDAQLAAELQAEESRQYARERRQSMARLQKQAEADRNFAEKLQQMMQEEESAQEKLDRAAAEELEAAERSRARAYTDNPSDSEDSSSDDDMEADSVDAEAEEESRRTREAEERRLRRDRVRMAGELDKQHRNLSWETRYFVLQGDFLHFYSMMGVAAAVRKRSPTAKGRSFQSANHGALLGQYELDDLIRVKHKKQENRRRFKLYFGAKHLEATRSARQERARTAAPTPGGGANGRQTVRLRAATEDEAVEWVTQISNSLSDRAFEKREAAAKAAADAAANADMAQPVALDAESGGGSKEPLKPKKEAPSISQSIAESLSASIEKNYEKLTKAGYVFESLEIFTEYQFERAYAALEKIVDTQRGQTVLMLEAMKATGRQQVTDDDYTDAFMNLVQLLRNEVTKFCAQWWHRQQLLAAQLARQNAFRDREGVELDLGGVRVNSIDEDVAQRVNRGESRSPRFFASAAAGVRFAVSAHSSRSTSPKDEDHKGNESGKENVSYAGALVGAPETSEVDSPAPSPRPPAVEESDSSTDTSDDSISDGELGGEDTEEGARAEATLARQRELELAIAAAEREAAADVEAAAREAAAAAARGGADIRASFQILRPPGPPSSDDSSSSLSSSTEEEDDDDDSVTV